MFDKKFISVFLVAILITAGTGMVLSKNDESDAVTSSTPLDKVESYIEDLSTQTPYTVARGTVFYLLARDSGTMVSQPSYSNGNILDTGLKFETNRITGILTVAVAGTMEFNFIRSGGIAFKATFNIVDTTSSSTDPWETMNLPAGHFAILAEQSPYYVNVGATINIPTSNVPDIENEPSSSTTVPAEFRQYAAATSVTPGYGLSVANGTLQGTVTKTGSVTVDFQYLVPYDHFTGSATRTFYIVDFNHADVRMIGGETWTYTPTSNMASVLSISGTATSWVSLTSGTVSGTAPTNTSVGQTYDLTISATTSDPNQNATQTVTFTVDPVITLSAPSTATIQLGAGTIDILTSNFDDGTRSIFGMASGSTGFGYTVDAATGVISYDQPQSHSLTFTATSPYTYTSGATNTASATVSVTVTGALAASVSGTLYLVTGKTVPNTPAEAVTLNHNDVGSGTYTWAVVGSNTSGVTVASDGTLGGTPGNVGTYAVTVRCTSVVDGMTQTADATLNIVIVAVLVFTSSPSEGTIV